VAVLTLLTVPLFTTAAFADGVGTHYDPDPLSPLRAWLIYGGTIVGGFLVAIVLAALSSRRSGPQRYRPGQPWEHGEIWVGGEPTPKADAVRRPAGQPIQADDEPADAATPGSGGASGSW
jgi:hypothetical protein